MPTGMASTAARIKPTTKPATKRRPAPLPLLPPILQRSHVADQGRDLRVAVLAAEAGHGGEAEAVLDGPEQLLVAPGLDVGAGEIAGRREDRGAESPGALARRTVALRA